MGCASLHSHSLNLLNKLVCNSVSRKHQLSLKSLRTEKKEELEALNN